MILSNIYTNTWSNNCGNLFTLLVPVHLYLKIKHSIGLLYDLFEHLFPFI